MKNPWKLWRPVYGFTWALAQRSSYEHFCRYTREKKNCLILDVGTGTGEYIKNLGKDNDYIFSDVDPKALNSARKKAAKYLPQERWNAKVGDADKVITISPKVDVISVIHVISVVKNPLELISKAMENLKPGGSLLIYISRFSAGIKHRCNPLTRALGFRLMNVGDLLPDYRKEKAGWLNCCYIVKKE